jgi:DNA segregation ATPase FtsK/SpoIIIE-like protein
MAKKKPQAETVTVKLEETPVATEIPIAEPEPKPKKEKKYDPNAFHDITVVVRSEYGENPSTYSAGQLEEFYGLAKAICEKSKQASCYEWMAALSIPYAVAVQIMDKMEFRKYVQPITYVDGVAVSSGPRALVTA